MLYATTRSDRDTYTAQRALTELQAPDGGSYVPFRELHFTESQILQMQEKSFPENMADFLYLLFNVKLTPWDLALAIGKRPLQLQKVGRRIAAGERWHNTAGDFSCTVENITDRIRAVSLESGAPGTWAEIGVGIAALFSLYAMMLREGFLDGPEKVDLAISPGNLCALASGWYARSWGLPIGRIVCGCPENSSLWELWHNGQMKTDGAEDGLLPRGLETLLYVCGGRQEVQRYFESCCFESLYRPGEGTLMHLREELYLSVVSDRRILETIPRVKSAHNYIMNPQTVLPYAGLLDYRAATGESGWGLILADRSPDRDLDTLAMALGMTREAAKSCLNPISI